MFKGWTGGFFPGVAAVPQFMILGPFFHLCRQLGLGTAGAVLACGAAETVITFGYAFHFSLFLNVYVSSFEIATKVYVLRSYGFFIF